MTSKPEPNRFETTQWSEVLLAGDPNQPGAREPLDRLCRKYWFPVYAVLRQRGASHPDAEDLTQAFFADILGSNKLAVADQSRGRFRWFLMTSCKNFASNVHRHRNSLRRGGSQTHVSLDVDMESGMRRYDSLGSQQSTPEQIFDRRWALQLIQLATQRVRDGGQAEWFDHLEPFIAPASDPPSHAEVAEQLEASVGAVKTAIHRLRKRFGVALQEETSETIDHRDDVKDELRILMEALSGL